MIQNTCYMPKSNEDLLHENALLKKQVKELESKYQASVNELKAYTNLTNNISDIIWTFDPIENKMLTISPSVQKVLGYTDTEYLNLTIDDILSESSLSLLKELIPLRYSDFITTKIVRNYTDNLTLLHKNGSEVSAELVSFFHYNANTNKIEEVGITRDISKRKEAEDKLQESEERFRSLMEQSPLAILICNKDGSVNSFNKAYLKMWNITKDNKDEISERLNVLHDQQLAEMGFTPFVKKALSGEVVKLPSVYYDAERTSDELKLETATKAKRWIECYFYPLKDNQGEIKHVVMFEDDITERKTAELQLRGSENKYRSIFETTANGIVLIDEAKQIVDCNNSFCKIFDYSKTDLIHQNYKCFLVDESEKWDQIFFENATEYSSKPNLFEAEGLRKDGSSVPIEINTRKIIIEGNQFYWGFIKDLSEQKSMDKRIFSTMVKSEEKERERYAKELHDGLGPLLSTGLIYVDTIINESNDKQLKEYAQRAHTILVDSTNTVKEISNNLSPVILNEYGMAQAIRSFIEKIRNATQIKFSINDELDQRFPEIIEFTIYRTLVELVNNAIKHSNARQLTIAFSMHQSLLKVSYTDNGDGFDLQKVRNTNKGFGLLNLENRIKRINGKYNYITSPGKGVQVTIKLKTQGYD